MRKGAIPVPYIVAIIFAIIVIALIAYMFFTHTGIFSGVATTETCEANKLKYCFDWSLSGKDNPPSGGWENYAPGCKEIGIEVKSGDQGVEECRRICPSCTIS